MVCPDCNGKGGFLPYEPGLFNLVCSTCGGYGIIHCCEGEQAQVGGPSAPLHQSATLNLPTSHLDPKS